MKTNRPQNPTQFIRGSMSDCPFMRPNGYPRTPKERERVERETDSLLKEMEAKFGTQ